MYTQFMQGGVVLEVMFLLVQLFCHLFWGHSFCHILKGYAKNMSLDRILAISNFFTKNREEFVGLSGLAAFPECGGIMFPGFPELLMYFDALSRLALRENKLSYFNRAHLSNS